MNIRELSQYAQFANLAYVKWKDVANAKIEDELIKAAYEAEHISGNTTTPSDTLGEVIFKEQGWQVLDHYPNDETGLSATLFTNGTEKILSIRGTEPGVPDLYEADLQDIGYYGVAIEQLVELYNYISLLSAEEGQEGIPQIEYHVSINEPVGQDYLRDPNIVSGFGQYHWFEVNHFGVGLGGLGWGDQISITGHSLGGHLAAAAIRLFPNIFDQAVTFNAPGFDAPMGVSPSLILADGLQWMDEFMGLFDRAGATPAPDFSSIQHNIFTIESESSSPGSDSSGISSDLTGQPPSQEIFITTEMNSHSMDQLMDALLIQAFIERLNPALSREQIGGIVEAASHQPGSSEEELLDALSELLLDASEATPLHVGEAGLISAADFETYRAPLQDRVIALEQAVSNHSDLTLHSLADLSSAEITNRSLLQDATGKAYRYALLHLNPFALTGNDALYAPHNQNGELDLYDETTREGTLTSSYLEDRAYFLTRLIERGTADSIVLPGDGKEYFRDYSSGIIAATASVAMPGSEFASYPTDSDSVRYVFGGNDADRLQGGDNADHLYGGGGSDTLIGNGGADHLEGGEGDDTYMAGDGDTILDADGFGRVLFGDTVLFGGVRYEGDPEGVFTSRDGAVTYRLEGENLIVSHGSSSLVIEHFRDLDLGIHLEEGTGPGDPTATLQGTADNDNGLDANTAPLIGTAGNDHIDGQAGLDILMGQAGDDLLEGGADTDILIGGIGNDRLHAGIEADSESIVEGLGSASTGDALSGQSGEDTLHGSHGADTLAGGGGEDLIYAGGGDDLIYGDSDRVVAGFEWFDGEGTIRYALDTIGYTWDSTPRVTLPGLAGVVNPIDSANDLIYAGDGNDTVWGQAGDDVIYGEGGDDRLDGDMEASGAAYLPGEYHGNDFIDGGSGDDGIRGLGGNDILFGGEGADWIEGDSRVEGILGFEYHGIDILDGGAGDDTLLGEGEGDMLFGGEGNDVLIGDLKGLDITYHGSDYLDGGAGNDELIGGGRSDRLYGGDGDDVLDGDSGDLEAQHHADDSLYGGAGADILIGNGGSDLLSGGGDDDSLYGDAGDIDVRYHGNDTLYGGDGTDTLVGSGGADVLYGEEGDDTLYGDSNDIGSEHHGDDTLDGGIGDDRLVGSGGSDRLYGGAGSDQLYGDSSDTAGQHQGDDILDGGDGDDLLVGSGGSDLLIGGEGNDQLSGDSADTAIAFQGDDTLYGGGGNDVLYGDGGDDTLSGGTGNDTLFGSEGNDRVFGDEGNDRVYGNEGDDTLSGGLGDDLVSGGDGADVVFGDAGNDQLGGGEGDDLIDGGAGADALYGHAGNDTLHGGADNDTLSGGDGADAVFGDAGNDQLGGGEGDDLLDGGAGTDALYGHAGNDTLHGGDGNDLLDGGDGNDILSGGSGYDILRGGDGEDTYLYNPGDGEVRIEDLSSNTLRFGGGIRLNTITLGLGSLKISTGTPGDEIHIEGFDPDNPYEASGITRFEFDDGTVFTHQELIEAVGFDFDGSDGDDTLIGTNARDRLSGFGGNDTLIGKDGDDTLDGGSGADAMSGGAGDDQYVVDDAGDTVLENPDAGLDSVIASVSFTLSDHVENLQLTGSLAIDGVGNGLANTLIGNDAANHLQGNAGDDRLYGKGGADILDGGSGADTLYGGAGDDVYLIDDGNDSIVEESNNGHDVVFSSVTYTLAEQVEGLNLLGATAIDGTGNDEANTLIGNTADNHLFGAGGNDLLEGGDGDDTLDGGAGADRLYGGQGDDRYRVDSVSDTVHENDLEGIDTVEAQISYSLGAHVENLVLSGNNAIHGEGNALDNAMTGNANDNRLDGGAGADLLMGSAGNDLYIVDHAGDRVIENIGEGHDRVESSVDMTLSDNIEDLILTGSAVSGVGNSLSNSITGNENGNRLEGGEGEDRLYGRDGDDMLSGGDGRDRLYGENGLDTIHGGEASDELYGGAANDTLMGDAGDDYLNGGSGIDVMLGGQGDDVYQVDDSADVIVEHANEGFDRVYSTTSFVLSEQLEDLYLQGYAAIDGTGNAQDNHIDGNAADNVLSGEAGDDVLTGSYGHNRLYGGAGNDTLDGRRGHSELYGGTGNDDYIIDSGTDVIIEALDSGYDRVQSSVSYTLAENLEALQLTGDASISGVGNALDNNLLGNDAENQLSGQAGDDYIDGAAGNDWLEGNGGDDILYGGDDAVRETYTVYGGGYYYGSSTVYELMPNDDHLDGGEGNDQLDGGSGNDTLYGGSGDDTLYGGDDGGALYGSQYYGGGYIANPRNDDYLNGGEGKDTLYGGTGNDELFGGTGQDELAGGTGNDLLDGGEALDVMAGGSGNDTYYVDGYAETVLTRVEDDGEPDEDGTGDCACDAIPADEDEDDNGKGNEGVGNGEDPPPPGHDDNWNDGAGTSPGSPGSKGGINSKGKDNDNNEHDRSDQTDDESETVTEASQNTPDDDDDDETGACEVNDPAGGETQIQYIEETIYHTDSVIEQEGEGYDVVYASITYALTNHVEELHLTGTQALNGTGNALNNRLYGNSADNLLDGGLGDDILQGGLGNDTYVIDSLYDVINETNDGGEDTVISSISYQLSDELEHLTLSGTQAINARGNLGDNLLTGNEADNGITGGLGNDTLNGGQGNDLLDGGEGDDLYLYELGDGLDTVTDTSGIDRIVFGEGIDLDLVAARTETVNGVTTVHLRILDQYGNEQIDQGMDMLLDPQNHTAPIESFVFADGAEHSLDELLIRSLEHDGSHKQDTLTLGRDDDVVWSGRGDDVVYGGTGNDILLGEAGEDTLWGQGGIDILFGGDDEDSLYGGGGNDLLFGGSDDDLLAGCQGNDLYVGGLGNDSLYLQCGYNVVLYNQGDGWDEIHLDEQVSGLTLSLGAGIALDDLSLEKDENDLILHVKGDEDNEHRGKDHNKNGQAGSAIVLDDWHLDEGSSEGPALTLQIITEAQAAFDAGSADPLLNQRIHQYDLGAVIQAFDEVRAQCDQQDPWSMTHAALDAMLLGSDEEAIGGELSYGYGMNAGIDALGSATFATLDDSRFGVSNQSINPVS